MVYKLNSNGLEMQESITNLQNQIPKLIKRGSFSNVDTTIYTCTDEPGLYLCYASLMCGPAIYLRIWIGTANLAMYSGDGQTTSYTLNCFHVGTLTSSQTIRLVVSQQGSSTVNNWNSNRTDFSQYIIIKLN